MKLTGSFLVRAAGLMVCAIAIDAFAQGGGFSSRSTISGFVFDEGRSPISQVTVELRNEFNSVLQRTKTQASGRYFFGGVPQGRFVIRVLPFGTGFTEQSEEVEIAGIGVMGRQLSENVQKDIYMRPAKERSSQRLKNAVVFAQEVPEEAERLYKLGSVDIDRQKSATGIQMLEQAISVFPNYFIALQKLAYVRLTQSEFSAAELLFERALAVNAESYESLYGLGITQYSLKKSIAAIATLEKAVIMRPESFESFLVLGMARRQEKQFDQAEKAFKQAVKVSDDTTAPDVYWNLALLYAHNMGRYADAAKQLELFLKLAPDAPNKEAIKKLIKEFKDKAHTT